MNEDESIRLYFRKGNMRPMVFGETHEMIPMPKGGRNLSCRRLKILRGVSGPEKGGRGGELGCSLK